MGMIPIVTFRKEDPSSSEVHVERVSGWVRRPRRRKRLAQGNGQSQGSPFDGGTRRSTSGVAAIPIGATQFGKKKQDHFYVKPKDDQPVDPNEIGSHLGTGYGVWVNPKKAKRDNYGNKILCTSDAMKVEDIVKLWDPNYPVKNPKKLQVQKDILERLKEGEVVHSVVIGFSKKHDRVMLIDGHHHVAGCLQIKRDSLPVIVIKVKKLDRGIKPKNADIPVQKMLGECGWTIDVDEDMSVVPFEPFLLFNMYHDEKGRFTSEGGSSGKQFDVAQLGAHPGLEAAAKQYSSQRGFARPAIDYSKIAVNEKTAKQIAAAYNAAPVHDPKADGAFAAMAKEIGQQYHFLTHDMGIKVDVVTKDPYATVQAMQHDVTVNHHISVLSTAATGAHAFFTNAQNDQFRAVHDVFGHAATGRGFDRHGEEAAWLSHSMMFSHTARQAMTTETRGQNSVLTQGGKGFPEQKLALLGDKFSSIPARLLRYVKALLSPASTEVHCIAGRAQLARMDYSNTATGLTPPVIPMQGVLPKVKTHPLLIPLAKFNPNHEEGGQGSPHYGGKSGQFAPKDGGGNGSPQTSAKPIQPKAPPPFHQPLGGRVSAPHPTTVAAESARAKNGPDAPVMVNSSLIQGKKVGDTLARLASVPGFEKIASNPDQKAAMADSIQRMANQQVDLFGQSMALGQEGTLAHAGWYPRANELGNQLATSLGYHPDQMSANFAVLSPGADWADNMAWSKHFAETIKNQDSIKTDAKTIGIINTTRMASYEAAMKSGAKATKPAPSDIKTGVKLSSLDDRQAAEYIRAMADAKGGLKQIGGQPGFGDPSKAAIPNKYESMTKAVSVLRDGSSTNIDKQLGQNLKVRSFYNNLREPLDTKYQDVTVDTHHYGAALGLPLGMSHPFIASGTASLTAAPKSGATGVSGIYPMVAESTRIATAAINKQYGLKLLPNQVQSVAWETHRQMYPSTMRKAGFINFVGEQRRQESAGTITRSQAMANVETERSRMRADQIGRNKTSLIPSVEDLRKVWAADGRSW